MPNHYHLVIRTSDYPLAAMMRQLNGQYAQYFRKKIATRGYLFQDRYKSIVAEDQRYIEELIRYVHLNPLRAKLCTSLTILEQYPWCGHGVATGRMRCRFQNTEDILRRFGNTLLEQRRQYRQFIKDGIDNSSDIDHIIRDSDNETEQMRSSSCWVIGNHSFIQNALAGQEARRLRVARYTREGIDIGQVCRITLERHGLSGADIRKRGRRSPQPTARKICAFVAHRTYDIPVIEIARHFGISSPSASRLVAGGEELYAEKT